MTVAAARRSDKAQNADREEGARPKIDGPTPDRSAPLKLGDAIVQAKLSVGPVHDVHEHEADAVADRVVRSLADTSSVPAGQDGSVAQGGRVQRSAAPVPADRVGVAGRIQRSGFTYGGGEEIRGTIDNQADLRKGIEDQLDGTFVGVRALFLAGGVVTSVTGWGELLFGLLAEDNDMGELTPVDCSDVVEDLKAEHRKEQFLQIAEFHGLFTETYGKDIWTLDDLKAELLFHHISVDDDGKDDATLEFLLDKRGDREAMQGEPQTSFKIGTAAHSLDRDGLKSTLDGELGSPVNWGHEITDCMDDSGKKGELYYYQSGSGLTAVGKKTQSHASSKGGRTIIWETDGGTTEILAIGKHTTRADSRLSKGASYEIVATFGTAYSGYRGKIVGFKS